MSVRGKIDEGISYLPVWIFASGGLLGLTSVAIPPFGMLSLGWEWPKEPWALTVPAIGISVFVITSITTMVMLVRDGQTSDRRWEAAIRVRAARHEPPN